MSSRTWSLTRKLAFITATVAGAPAPAQNEGPKFVGRASCATATCHGGSLQRGHAWNHALTLFTALDPHADAAMLLRDDDSRRIVLALEPGAEQSPEAFDNVLRTRCISCHGTVEASDCEPRGLIEETLLAEGVSCEACHGPAEHWLAPHVRLDWQVATTARAGSDERLGMRDTGTIPGRAETCVRCHVGSRSADGVVRDMNHDLIAAGHPALRFDFLLYHESLPAHWNESNEPELAFAASALRVRNSGRAISLAAAAALAGERASDHLKGAAVPWPELADYDCFACHQSLSEKEFRLPPRLVKRSLHISEGLPMWNSWHSIGQLREKQLLKALAPQRSQPAEVARVLPGVAAAQRAKAEQAVDAEHNPRQSIEESLTTLQRHGVRDWHEAAVLYLDLDAALRDEAKQPDAAQRAAQQRQRLVELVEPELRFTPPADAQHRREPSVFHSPADFDADAFRTAVLTALQHAPDAAEQARVTNP